MTPSLVVVTPHLQSNGLFKSNSQVQLSCTPGYNVEVRATAPLEKLYTVSSNAKCVYHSGAMRWLIGSKVATSVSCRSKSIILHYASVSFRTA